MAKEKQTRRMIAMALAAAVTMSSVPVVAFAEDGVTPPPAVAADSGDSVTTTDSVTTDNGDGTSTTVETTTTATGDAATSNDGQPGAPIANGSTETTTTATLTDSEGNVLSVEVTKEGSSVETTDKVDTEGKNQTSVEVDMVPGQETTGTGTTTTTTTETVPNGDGTTTEVTTTTTTTDRVVTVKTGDVTTTQEKVENPMADSMTPVGPEDYEGKVGITDKTPDSNTANPNAGNGYGVDGYDFQHAGFGETSTNGVSVSQRVKYQLDEDGNVVFEEKTDEDGNVVYETEIDEDGNEVYKIDENGNKIPVMVPVYKFIDHQYVGGGSFKLGQWMLWDKEGNPIYTYCVDEEIQSVNGHWYKVENLEDSDYFVSEDSAERLRGVVESGYWGTAPYETDENGNPVVDADGNPVLKTGSLEKMKADILKALEENRTFGGQITEDGKFSYATWGEFDVAELVDGLTEGQALAVTQAAIYACSTGSTFDLDKIDPERLDPGRGNIDCLDFDAPLGLLFYCAYENGGGRAAEARMMMVYHYLMSVAEETSTERKDSVIIDDDSFLVEDGGLSITVGDKLDDFVVNGEEVNNDGNADNDVYNTSISFTMVVEPSTEKGDDMVVKLVDSEGHVIRQAILAGEGKAGEVYDTVEKNGTTYTFKDLPLQENSPVTFDLKLEGIQHLEQGVYLYEAHGGFDQSQTFVGLAEGERDFAVNTTFNVEFDVDENDKTVVKRSYRTHKVTVNDPETDVPKTEPKDPTPDPEDPNPTPDPEDPGMTIEDEDVPLADAPVDEEGMVLGAEDEEEPMVLGAEDEAPLIAATGDSNHMTAGFGGMLAALAGMFMLRKKKEN